VVIPPLVPPRPPLAERRSAARDAIIVKFRHLTAISMEDLSASQSHYRADNRIKSMKGAWKSACEKAGCPEMLMHDMRRSAVRNLVRAGVSERVAMEITGHLIRDIFDRYDIVNESDLENALGRLDDEGGTILGQSAVFSGKEAVESSRVM
jgi:hypothetical protein